MSSALEGSGQILWLEAWPQACPNGGTISYFTSGQMTHFPEAMLRVEPEMLYIFVSTLSDGHFHMFTLDLV